jgi:hypothetical protein
MSSVKMIVEIRPLAGWAKGYKGTIIVKNNDGTDDLKLDFTRPVKSKEDLNRTRSIKDENITERLIRSIVRENCGSVLENYVIGKITEISSAPPNARLFSVEIFPRPWLDLEVSDFE